MNILNSNVERRTNTKCPSPHFQITAVLCMFLRQSLSLCRIFPLFCTAVKSHVVQKTSPNDQALFWMGVAISFTNISSLKTIQTRNILFGIDSQLYMA